MIEYTDDSKYLKITDDYTDIISLDTGNNVEYLQNYDALSNLKEEVFTLYKSYLAIAGLSLVGLAFSPLASLGLGALLSAGKSLEYFRRVARIHDTMKMLLDCFGDDGIKITPRVKTNSAIIDLFVRMPDKRIFALMLRSSENTSVKWREDNQQFYVKKKGKSEKKSDPLNRTIKKLNTIIDLKKAKSPLIGTSSAERNAPVIKTIVLSPGAQIAASNSPELWTEFGQARALKLCTPSITYVVHHEDLIKFLSLPEK